ncbi:transcriptional regulator domain protein [Mycobacterium xenopi 3993]|nr:transcriptional regulator domain protein [Mycobacterium xenopi 3993]
MGWNRRLQANGVRAGQLGRQYIPVVNTAVTNQLSNRAFLDWTAR